MLIKTKEFHRQFLKDLSDVLLFSKKYKTDLYQMGNKIYDLKPLFIGGISIFGSYPIKPYGDIITDIDVFQSINAVEDRFILRIQEIFLELKRSRSNFSFIRFYAGEDKNLIIPWGYGDKGACKFDYEKVMTWLKTVEDNKYLPEEPLKRIQAILHKDTLSFKDIFNCEIILESHANISWNLEDIIKGEKIVRGITYNLKDVLKDYRRKRTFKLLYKFGTEYCLVDLSLKIGKKVEYEVDASINSYYKDSIINIFKNIKYYVPVSEKHKYIALVRRSSGKYTGLTARLELLGKLKKYGVLSISEMLRLEKEVLEYGKSIGLETNDENVVKEKIEKEIRVVFDEGMALVPVESKELIRFYTLRSAEASLQIPINELKRRILEGYECPFFEINSDDMKFLVNLSRRAMVDIGFLIECIRIACKNQNKDVNKVAHEIFPKNNLHIEKRDDKFILKIEAGKGVAEAGKEKGKGVAEAGNDNEKSFEFESDDLKQLQLYVFLKK